MTRGRVCRLVIDALGRSGHRHPLGDGIVVTFFLNSRLLLVFVCLAVDRCAFSLTLPPGEDLLEQGKAENCLGSNGVYLVNASGQAGFCVRSSQTNQRFQCPGSEGRRLFGFRQRTLYYE